jgi:hypothetical protein
LPTLGCRRCCRTLPDGGDKITSLAVGDPETQTAGQTFRIRQDASQDTHIEGLPIGTTGGILANVTLPLDGSTFGSACSHQSGVVRGLIGISSVQSTACASVWIGGDDDFKANLKNMTKAGDDVERAAFPMPLKAGPYTITVAFLERTAAVNPLGCGRSFAARTYARYHQYRISTPSRAPSIRPDPAAPQSPADFLLQARRIGCERPAPGASSRRSPAALAAQRATDIELMSSTRWAGR